ncbi:hypothetical protein [Saccharothrix xinjiangensis]|uniref:DUF3500 domain-containing protein n=1 Tax=Saccharothrix xinjiangensis TaxID=204798 RepID=A0ABV9Y3R4_9PSEU
MRTGPLAEVLGEERVEEWTRVATELRNDFLADDDLGAEEKYDLVKLCTVYYAHGKPRAVEEHIGGLRIDYLSDVVDIVERLMEGNGQWSYLRGQEWFEEGEHVVAVDVNYYPNRRGFSLFPGFHKDTAGDNVFVNLVFDNDKPTEATEWFADLAEPGEERAERQRRLLLPQSHLEELAHAREVLRARGEATREVRGGVSPHRHTYLSWVDEFVWHATPTPTRRIHYSAEAALAAYEELDSTSEGAFLHVDQEHRAAIAGAEVVATIGDCSGTHLEGWLAARDLGVQDVTPDVARTAWRELYRGGDGAVRFEEDVRERGGSTWRITGRQAVANSPHPHLPDSSEIVETPVGLSNRERANSSAENREALLEVREANAGEPRSFLRTWVRVVAVGGDELEGVEFSSP